MCNPGALIAINVRLKWVVDECLKLGVDIAFMEATGLLCPGVGDTLVKAIGPSVDQLVHVHQVLKNGEVLFGGDHHPPSDPRT